MILTDLLSLLLRIGELAFSATVAGLTGEYLHKNRGQRASQHKRMIYTITVAAISILFSLLFLLPFLGSFAKWPVDLVLFVLWIVAFALLADFNGDNNCGGVWNWGGITNRDACGRYKANMAFSFLAAIFFLVSAIIVSRPYYIRASSWNIYLHIYRASSSCAVPAEVHVLIPSATLMPPLAVAAGTDAAVFKQHALLPPAWLSRLMAHSFDTI